MRILFILNDPPYGTERAYNALRLASALLKNDASCQVTLFLLAAVMMTKSGQRTPDGFYNLERILKRVVVGKGNILVCGTCMDARGLTDTEFVEGAQRSTMDELAKETVTVERVIVW